MKTMLYDGSDKVHAQAGKMLRELPAKKNGYVLIVKENRPVRSLSANGYYWKVLEIIGIHTGHDREFLHEEMKRKFNSEPVEFPKSGMVLKAKSTKDLDTKEFGAYVNRVKNWAREEWDIIIPEPQDMDYLKLMEIDNQYSHSFSGY